MPNSRTAVPAAVGALIALMASGAVADPRLTIEEPADGAIVSGSESSTLTISGTVDFDEPLQNQESIQFFLRAPHASDCINANRRLSLDPGTDEDAVAEQCMTSGGENLWPDTYELVFGNTDSSRRDFPTVDGVPLTYDASQPISGTIVVRSCGDGPGAPPNTGQGWCNVGDTPLGQGVGLSTLHAILTGEAGDDTHTLAETTVEYQVTPDQKRYPIDFSIPPNPALDKMDIDRLNLRVYFGGPAVNHGMIGLNGESFIDLPVWTPSSATGVEVGIADSTLSASGVTVGLDGTWSATRPTPPEGDRTVVARAFQGHFQTEVVERRIVVVD